MRPVKAALYERRDVSTLTEARRSPLDCVALGLLAAIPAVVFYNKITNDIGKLGIRLETFSGEFASIISRQLDESV